MKHLLNNISEEEKQSILEQHKGGMKIFNENFNKMVNKKLGHVELFEQQSTMDSGQNFRNSNRIKLNTIKNQDDLNLWKRIERADLAYKALTGLDLGFAENTEMEKRMSPILEELMLFIAQRCDVPGDCASTVKNSNLVDVYLKNKKAILDELSIEPLSNLDPFKKHLSNLITGKIRTLADRNKQRKSWTIFIFG